MFSEGVYTCYKPFLIRDKMLLKRLAKVSVIMMITIIIIVIMQTFVELILSVVGLKLLYIIHGVPEVVSPLLHFDVVLACGSAKDGHFEHTL